MYLQVSKGSGRNLLEKEIVVSQGKASVYENITLPFPLDFYRQVSWYNEGVHTAQLSFLHVFLPVIISMAKLHVFV